MNDTSPTLTPHVGNTSQNILSELLLIGNIMHNIDLINEYAGALSVHDFSDEAARYFYTVLESYYAVYGSEEIEGAHLSLVIFKLMEDSGLRMPSGITKKNCLQRFWDVKRLGSPQPADNNAYRIVKRDSMLRQLAEAKIDVADICERDDFADLTADNVIGLVYEKLDPLANAASQHPHEDFSSNITERVLRFFEKPEIGLQTPFALYAWAVSQ